MDKNIILTESQERILELIPYGKNKAIAKGTLVDLTGFNERKIRKIVSELRDYYVIVSSSGGKGFYRPTNRREVQEFIDENTRRAKKIFTMIQTAKRYMVNHQDQEHFVIGDD